MSTWVPVQRTIEFLSTGEISTKTVPISTFPRRKIGEERGQGCGGSCTRILRDVLSDSAHAERNGTHLRSNVSLWAVSKRLPLSKPARIQPVWNVWSCPYRFRWTSYPPSFSFFFFLSTPRIPFLFLFLIAGFHGVVSILNFSLILPTSFSIFQALHGNHPTKSKLPIPTEYGLKKRGHKPRNPLKQRSKKQQVNYKTNEKKPKW